jgi:choline dehydrogenase-like flavoprotein
MTSHADVLIIGAGGSGGVAAKRFAEAGFSVVCLEQGSWVDRSEYRGPELDWELTARKQWSSLPMVRGGAADYPVDESDNQVPVHMFNGVGGGTILWGGSWYRFTPSDFRVRTDEGVADDWPLTYDELVPYYERVERQFGVAGLGGNPAYPSGKDVLLPPLPIGSVGRRIADAHTRLGWHWWPASAAILSVPRGDRHPCVQRGTCAQGCSEGAKASADLTHWSAAIQERTELITGARVVSIVVDRKGLAAGAVWIDRNGLEHFQPADVVVCAANAIGTSRLLLASTSAQHLGGLGNSSDLVGRRLMRHVSARVGGVFEDRVWHGQTWLQCMEFYSSVPSRGFIRGAKWSIGRPGGPLGSALEGGSDGAGVWGLPHHEEFARNFRHIVNWHISAEDLPDAANRVTLSRDLADSDGLAAPKVTYQISDNTSALLAWNAERARESLLESGAQLVIIPNGRSSGSGHLMGTARMGNDPRSSVVNRWGVSHDVPNLAIVDGSVFVTAAAVNPTATISALALRTAEHLIENASAMPRPAQQTVISMCSPHRTPPSFEPTEEVDISQILSSDTRAQLGKLADELIPAAGLMPRATDVDVSGAGVDFVLQARPDLAVPLAEAVRIGATLGLAELRTQSPSAFRTLTLVVAGAYYANTRVRNLIDYQGQPAIPIRVTFPEYIEDGLIEKVLVQAKGREGWYDTLG